MDLCVSDQVSFCRVDDQTFLLDLRSGRYSQLHQPAARAFERLRLGQSLDDIDVETLSPLIDAGLIERRAGAVVPAEICAAKAITRCLLDQPCPGGVAPAILSAFLHLTMATLGLRVRGLTPMLRHLARRKSRLLASDRIADVSPETAAWGFVGLDGLIGRRDRCLPRSIALASRLIADGMTADVVFGVTGRPFHAHCWVQVDDLLVSDRLEHVRDYTPILVI